LFDLLLLLVVDNYMYFDIGVVLCDFWFEYDVVLDDDVELVWFIEDVVRVNVMCVV